MLTVKLLSEAVKNFFSLYKERLDEWIHPLFRKVVYILYFIILIPTLIYSRRDGEETFILVFIFVVPLIFTLTLVFRLMLIEPIIDVLISAIWRLLKLIYFKIVLYAQQINKKNVSPK
jgi:hypothetical protein